MMYKDVLIIKLAHDLSLYLVSNHLITRACELSCWEVFLLGLLTKNIKMSTYKSNPHAVKNTEKGMYHIILYFF